MDPLPAPEPSWRKPAGVLLILAMLAAWTVAVAMLVDSLGLHPLLQGLFYLVGGIAWLWLFPMRRLLAWMETGRWR
jgi:hypothetical protein